MHDVYLRRSTSNAHLQSGLVHQVQMQRGTHAATAACLLLVGLLSARAADEDSCAARVGRRLLAPDGRAVELVQVAIVHRHGDRAPIWKQVGAFLQTPELEAFWRSRVPARGELERWGRLNTDPTGTWLQTEHGTSKYSFPNGHLTALGAHQLRRVGAELRERYIGDLSFLPSDLPPAHAEELIQARSTRIPRTIQSVQNLLLGLYPEDHRPLGQGADTLARQGGVLIHSQEQGRVLIHSQDKERDFMTGLNDKRCPRIKRHIAEADVGMEVPSNSHKSA